MRIWAFILLAAPALFGADTRAWELYQSTKYREALNALEGRKDPDSLKLAAQAYYGLEDYKKAIEVLETAIAAAPERSDLHLWLGRAYGRRAETSNMLAAPRHASRARQGFEKAVELNPSNTEALSDLFEYYLQAPGFLGGGKDKAEAVGKKIAALDKAEGFFAEARLQEERKDFAAAEQSLRKAVAAAPSDAAGRLIDLAKFLARRGRLSESEAEFEKAAKLGANLPKLLFARAVTYLEGKRNQAQARAMLQQYLKAPLTPDDPPRKEAEKLLKQLDRQ